MCDFGREFFDRSNPSFSISEIIDEAFRIKYQIILNYAEKAAIEAETVAKLAKISKC